MSGKKATYEKKGYYFSGIEKLHPYQSLLYLFNFVSAITMVFLVFSLEIKIAGEERELHHFDLPDVFMLATLLLFGTLIFTRHQAQLYKEEKLLKLKKNYYAVLFLSTLFIAAQMVAVYMFRISDASAVSQEFSSYFILLVSYHLFHLVMCVVFLIWLLFRVVNSMEDPVKMLVFVTNSYEALLMKLKNIAWNFQVAMWIALFVYFVFRF